MSDINDAIDAAINWGAAALALAFILTEKKQATIYQLAEHADLTIGTTEKLLAILDKKGMLVRDDARNYRLREDAMDSLQAYLKWAESETQRRSAN